jgi:ATP-dependent RNA helicase DDX51/DBP6
MLVCETVQKPLMFFHLVHKHNVTNALVFTKSAESTARLVKLLEFFEKERTGHMENNSEKEIIARAYSSDLPPAERKSILDQFKSQEIQMFVTWYFLYLYNN